MWEWAVGWNRKDRQEDVGQSVDQIPVSSNPMLRLSLSRHSVICYFRFLVAGHWYNCAEPNTVPSYIHGDC